jgi:DNA-binding transcriptional regulator YdaS (Cro superfamily)
MEVPSSPLERVLTIVGNQSRLATALGVRPQAVQQWLQKGVPPERTLATAAVVDFKVTPHELRPDLYPHPDDGLPESLRMGGPGPVEILDQLREVMTEDELRELTLAIDEGEAIALGYVRGLAEKHRVAWTDTLIAQGLAAIAKERRP